MSGAFCHFVLVELSSVGVLAVLAVRTRSALTTAKSSCRPPQTTCAALPVIGSFFVVIASLISEWTSA